VTGSHLDTVPTGGRFDGALGVLAGLEVIRSLKDQAISLRHPLEVVAFADEESTMVGCKGMTGVASNNPADYTCSNGQSISDNLPRTGGNWQQLAQARRSDDAIAAFVELHVEQGGILESRGDAIGLVEGVVGQRRFLVRVEGQANHAGTTPMDARQDALATAAQVILAVQELANNHPGDPVGTVGKLQLWPNAANVVPGQVELSVDLRDLSLEVLSELVEDLESRLRSISRASGCPISLLPQFSVDPTPAHLSVTEAIAASAQTLGLSCSALPSRASHDSQEMGRRWPMGMIFVPSQGGLSHSAAEFTSSRQCSDGTAVLMQSLVRLDQRLNKVPG
jgi:N-carbamoyl-L-amino-acid hydrolase